MTRPLFHPRLMQSLGNFFPWRCAAQEQHAALGMTGQRKGAGWADVAGLTDLACSIVELSSQELAGTIPGRRNAEYQNQAAVGADETIATHEITFQGCYPITTKQRLLVAAGPFAGAYSVNRAYPDQLGLQTIVEASSVE